MGHKVGMGYRITGNEWDIIRTMVLARDNCTCQFHKLGLPELETCTHDTPSRRVRNLQAHHKKQVEFGGSNDLDNLITLCFEHHCLIHPHLRFMVSLPQQSFELPQREFDMPEREFELKGMDDI